MSQSTNRPHTTDRHAPRDNHCAPPESLIEIAELALDSTEPQRLVNLACRLTDIIEPDKASALIDEEGQRIAAAFLAVQAEIGWGWDGESGWGEADWDIESAVVHQLNHRLNAMARACALVVADRACIGAGRTDPIALLMGHLSKRLERSCQPGRVFSR